MLRNASLSVALLAGAGLFAFSALPVHAQGFPPGAGKPPANPGGGGGFHAPGANPVKPLTPQGSGKVGPSTTVPGTGKIGPATTVPGSGKTFPGTPSTSGTGTPNNNIGGNNLNRFGSPNGLANPRANNPLANLESGLYFGPYNNINLVGRWWETPSAALLTGGYGQLNNNYLSSLYGNPFLSNGFNSSNYLGANPYLYSGLGTQNYLNTNPYGFNNSPYGFNSSPYGFNSFPQQGFGSTVNPAVQAGINILNNWAAMNQAANQSQQQNQYSPFNNPYTNPFNSPFTNPWNNPLYSNPFNSPFNNPWANPFSFGPGANPNNAPGFAFPAGGLKLF